MLEFKRKKEKDKGGIINIVDIKVFSYQISFQFGNLTGLNNVSKKLKRKGLASFEGSY